MIDADCLMLYRQFNGDKVITRYGRLVTGFHEKSPADSSVTN
jgi:hypothetical protein